jgi:hypothetical protein
MPLGQAASSRAPPAPSGADCGKRPKMDLRPLALNETQHETLHRRLPLRQRPIRGLGSALPGRGLPLPGLSQASWCALLYSRNIPRGGGDDRGRDARRGRPLFLPALRLVRLRPKRRPTKAGPSAAKPGCRRFSSRDATTAIVTPRGGPRRRVERNAGRMILPAPTGFLGRSERGRRGCWSTAQIVASRRNRVQHPRQLELCRRWNRGKVKMGNVPFSRRFKV